MAPDTIFRFYSMTKPLTSTAIMMLVRGRPLPARRSDHPLSVVLQGLRVFAGGMRGKLGNGAGGAGHQVPRSAYAYVGADVRVHGGRRLSMRSNRDRGVDFHASDKTLAEVVEIAADIPLIAQPGAEWNYSIATDVLGHLVAVISASPFDQFPA